MYDDQWHSWISTHCIL